eukprot:12760621-Prorocentrum_lima.AAC.1
MASGMLASKDGPCPAEWGHPATYVDLVGQFHHTQTAGETKEKCIPLLPPLPSHETGPYQCPGTTCG